MPGERERLVRRIAELAEVNDELRAALLRHKEALADAAERLQSGALTAAGVREGGAAGIRVDLTRTLEDFERARHRVRVALFAFMGIEQGTTTAEIGRSLGISRQLASRLAQQAESEHRSPDDGTSAP